MNNNTDRIVGVLGLSAVCVLLAGFRVGWGAAFLVGAAIVTIMLIIFVGNVLKLDDNRGRFAMIAQTVLAFAILALLGFIALFLPCAGQLCN